MKLRIPPAIIFSLVITFALLAPRAASAQERLCDPSFENCLWPTLDLIRAETSGIDVELYMIEHTQLADEIIARYNAGVPVRLIVEPRADLKFPMNQTLLDKFKAAGIPMRYKLGDGIIHAKAIVFGGLKKVIFTG